MTFRALANDDVTKGAVSIATLKYGDPNKPVLVWRRMGGLPTQLYIPAWKAERPSVAKRLRQQARKEGKWNR